MFTCKLDPQFFSDGDGAVGHGDVQIYGRIGLEL